MKFYGIKETTSLKEIGEFPQIQNMSNGYDFDASNSVYQLHAARNTVPKFEPNLDSFVLHSSAKLTDVLSASPISGMGLILSAKSKNILDRYNLIENRYYPASILFQNQLIKNEYYWFHLVSTLDRNIFFSQSYFKRSGGDSLVLNDYNHYLRERERLGKFVIIKASKMKMKMNDVAKYDLFMIPKLDSIIYVSERLKNELINSGVTGLEFFEMDNIELI
jgi:hypothetical protein